MNLTNDQTSTVVAISLAVAVVSTAVTLVNCAMAFKAGRRARNIVATHKVADELFDRLRGIKQA